MIRSLGIILDEHPPDSLFILNSVFRMLFHVVFYLYITSVLLTACELCLGMLIVLFKEPPGVFLILIELFTISMTFTSFEMAISALRSMLRNFPE